MVQFVLYLFFADKDWTVYQQSQAAWMKIADVENLNFLLIFHFDLYGELEDD